MSVEPADIEAVVREVIDAGARHGDISRASSVYVYRLLRDGGWAWDVLVQRRPGVTRFDVDCAFIALLVERQGED